MQKKKKKKKKKKKNQKGLFVSHIMASELIALICHSQEVNTCH